MGHKPTARVWRMRGQRRHAREHAVLVCGHIQQHDRQRGLVKVLGVVGRHAHPHGAAPVGDLRQFAAQVVEQRLGVVAIVVGDVEQAQGGRCSVVGQRHLGAQLRQHQRGGHAPLGVGGMASGK